MVSLRSPEGMAEDKAPPTKSEALRASAAKLIQHSRELRQASERIAKEANDLAKLVPKRDLEAEEDRHPDAKKK